MLWRSTTNGYHYFPDMNRSNRWLYALRASVCVLVKDRHVDSVDGVCVKWSIANAKCLLDAVDELETWLVAQDEIRVFGIK